jgi:predicted outer membrane protein
MPRLFNLAAIMLLLEAAGCSSVAQVPAGSALGPEDVTAVTAAYQLIQFDLAECQVVVADGASRHVALAGKICQDAALYQGKLQAIAVANDITLPTELRYELNSEYVQLHYHLGAATDVAYLRDQVGSHEAALAIFRDESANGRDPAVKFLSAGAVPVVRRNLDALQAMLARVPARG